MNFTRVFILNVNLSELQDTWNVFAVMNRKSTVNGSFSILLLFRTTSRAGGRKVTERRKNEAEGNK